MFPGNISLLKSALSTTGSGDSASVLITSTLTTTTTADNQLFPVWTLSIVIVYPFLMIGIILGCKALKYRYGPFAGMSDEELLNLSNDPRVRWRIVHDWMKRTCCTECRHRAVSSDGGVAPSGVDPGVLGSGFDDIPTYEEALTMPKPMIGSTVRFQSSDNLNVSYTFTMSNAMDCEPPAYCTLCDTDVQEDPSTPRIDDVDPVPSIFVTELSSQRFGVTNQRSSDENNVHAITYSL